MSLHPSFRYLALAILSSLLGCSTVPETGRRQLILLSVQQEQQLGFSSFETMKSSVPISQDREQIALLKKVGERIAQVSGLPKAQWEFVLFDSPEANAFCLPGGKVGVFTGILPITQDEAGLATVIGHEVAHAVARHGAERVSEAMMLQLGGGVLQSGLESYGYDTKTQAAAATVYGMTTQLGPKLGRHAINRCCSCLGLGVITVGLKSTLKHSSPQLEHHGLGDPFSAMPGHRMGHFMTDHRRQAGFILRDGKNTGEHANLTTWKAESVGLRAVKEDKFPLGLGQPADLSNPLPHFFEQGNLLPVLTYGNTRFHGFKGAEPQLLLLLNRQQDQLPSTRLRYRRTSQQT